jgi:hypothetical protein
VASPGGSRGPLVEEYWLNEAQALSDARVTITGIPRQNTQLSPKRSFGELSPLSQSRFHTVCKKFAQRLKC